MLYSVCVYYGYGNSEYYAVVADDKKQAREKLEIACKDEGSPLTHYHSIDIDEADLCDQDVAYIIEKSG